MLDLDLLLSVIVSNSLLDYILRFLLRHLFNDDRMALSKNIKNKK